MFGVWHEQVQAKGFSGMAMNLYVGNLSFQANDDELNQLFSQFGEVVSAKVIMDRETGRSRGFGFVEMANEKDGEAAVAELDQKDFLGRNVRVNPARPREERPSRDSSHYGGDRY
jgi:cold-inducible RNA-binding protein